MNLPLVAAMAAVFFHGTGAIAAPGEIEIERIVAVVNGDVILASELERRLKNQPKSKSVLTQMVQERLVVQQAERLGVRVSSADVDAAILEIKSANKLSDKAFSHKLREQGYLGDEFRVDVREQIARLRVVNAAVARGAIREERLSEDTISWIEKLSRRSYIDIRN